MEKPRRAFRNVTPVPMLHRYPANATCAKVAGVGGKMGNQELVGYPATVALYSRRYLVRLLARQFALLYYKERRSIVCKSATRARRRRPTLRNRRARLSTVAELRQLDKTAASEASRRENKSGRYRCSLRPFGFTRISTLFTKCYEIYRAQLSQLNQR